MDKDKRRLRRHATTQHKKRWVQRVIEHRRSAGVFHPTIAFQMETGMVYTTEERTVMVHGHVVPRYVDEFHLPEEVVRQKVMKRARRFTITPQPCSCHMCGNARKYAGPSWKERY